MRGDRDDPLNPLVRRVIFPQAPLHPHPTVLCLVRNRVSPQMRHHAHYFVERPGGSSQVQSQGEFYTGFKYWPLNLLKLAT